MASFSGVVSAIGKRAGQGFKAGADTYAGKETGSNASSMLRKVGQKAGGYLRKRMGKRKRKNGNGKSGNGGGGKMMSMY